LHTKIFTTIQILNNLGKLYNKNKRPSKWSLDLWNGGVSGETFLRTNHLE